MKPLVRLYELPGGREVRALLDTIHEIEQRGAVVFPCVLIDGLRDRLGIGGATNLILTLMEAGAVEVDTDGVKLTDMGERLRRDVHGVWGLAESIIAIDAPANDTRPAEREGHA